MTFFNVHAYTAKTNVNILTLYDVNSEQHLRGVEWVHDLFLFPLVLENMKLPNANLGLFLCSLDNLLQKNVIVFFFGNHI